MLVFTLKSNDSFTLKFPGGEEGTVKILKSSKTGRVTVGIEMPEDVDILRGRLLDKIGVFNDAVE